MAQAAKVGASAAMSGRPYQTELSSIEVRIVALASVRIKFVEMYPAEGDDEEKRAGADRKAFTRP